MYCVLLPFSLRIDEPVTQLQLLFIDEPLLTLTDKVWVTESRSEACATRARMHVDLVSPSLLLSSSFCSHVCLITTRC